MISKRECRKHADPGLPFDPGNGLLHTPLIDYLTRSAIKIIAGRRVLVLYFYDRKSAQDGCTTPEYTLYQYRDDYITLERTDDGNVKWRTASLDNMGSRYAYITKTSAFYRRNDEQRVTMFCGDTVKEGFEALTALQERIVAHRLTIRTKDRERRIVSRMKPIPTAPRGLNEWIQHDVLPHYIFYDYSKSKQKKGYCTSCRCDIHTSEAKHRADGKCPQCGKAITFIASGRAANIWDRATVQSVHKVNDTELVIRIFKAYISLKDWRQPDISIWENARLFIRQTETKEAVIEPFYYASGKGILTDWKRGSRPRFSHYQYSFECDICGILYTRNLDDALKGTPWQYCQLDRFNDSISRESMELLPYLTTYHVYPALEYLVKLGFAKLTHQMVYTYENVLINRSGKNLREALDVWPEDVSVLQRIDTDANQLELCQQLRKQGIRPDEALLIWYRKHNILSTENILNPLAYTTPGKLMQYVNEQYNRLKDVKTHGVRRMNNHGNVLSLYKDYLEMGGKLNYDFSDGFVLFPKNMQEAHDHASKLFDIKKSAVYNKAIRSAYKGLLEQYRFAHEEFTLMPPKTASEIVKEGHALHHCVHTYVERVAEGRCVILFVRRSDNIKAPYYTVEIQDNRIIQVHGLHHRKPTPEVTQFLSMWKAKKLQAVNA